jgi:hypothetical protein
MMAKKDVSFLAFEGRKLGKISRKWEAEAT